MGLHWIDFGCIAGYMLFMIVLGSWFAKGQKSTKDYFLAGKSIRWLPLAISMYATLFSSISYVMAPAEAFRGDAQYLITFCVYPLASVLAIVLFIDFYVRLRITTVFEYMERRFTRWMSLIMLAVYALYRCLYAGIVVFSVSLVLSATMGFKLVPTMIGVGVAAIIYTTLGGMKAVIWTDVVQFFILLGGILTALCFAINGVDGGIAEIWRTCDEDQKLRVINTSFSLTERYTFWTLMLLGVVGFLGNKSVDQMNVQRYLSARTGGNAKLAMFTQSLFTVPIWLLLFAVGMSLYVYYLANPDPNVAEFISKEKYDHIFPYFIGRSLPVGVRGLMIAALLAAAMSTMDSVLNVLATISIVDVYKNWINPEADDRTCLARARILTVIWGVVVILLAICMMDMKSILKTVNSVAGIFIGPLLGIFLLGMFTRRANGPGAIIGMAVASGTVLCMKYLTPITFTVFGATGLLLVLVVGYLASLAFPAPPPEKLTGLMWKWRGLREMLFASPPQEAEST